MAKLLASVQDLRLSFGERELLHIDNLEIFDGDRIGLIGENGAGKSTLLSLLAGSRVPDEGTVRLLCEPALIGQQGAAADAEDRHISSLFRAPEEHGGLSGGEQTRRRIASAFSSRTRLLLADEPTTDLDGQGIALLTRHLRDYPGALVLVSHDRNLLRTICRRIWYLEDGHVTDFPGGYDAFRAEQDRQRERAQFEYDQYRGEQARLKAAAQKMAERASSVRKAPSRMGNSEARLHTREWTDAVLQLSHAKRTLQNRMEQMEVKEKPRSLPDIRMKLGVAHPVGARTVLGLRCDSLEAGGTPLLQNTALSLPTGSKTALLGPNGCGKTTLLSVLADSPPKGVTFRGNVRFNPEARVGWFDQHHDRTLRADRTVLENIMEESSLPESLARTVLACLGFPREDAFKPVSMLSGGERAKTALARLLLMDCNLLILDEPTNHLDLFTLEALEELLTGYGGTLLFVSHDEAFVNRVATRTVRFENCALAAFEGTPAQQAETARARESGRQQMDITLLEMRMADLAARMAKPKKGDRPDQLNAEYLALAEELRLLKQS